RPFDGTTTCRAVTASGMGTSLCQSVDRCAVGFTCVASTDGAWCQRFCSGDSDCSPAEGSRCIIDIDGHGPLQQRTCTNACGLLVPAGCPSGLACQGVPQGTNSCTYCRKTGSGQTNSPCGLSTDCAEGFACAGTTSGATCKRYCNLSSGTCAVGT